MPKQRDPEVTSSDEQVPESDELLHDIIAADRAEEMALIAWEAAKQEAKLKKEIYEEAVERRKAAGRAAREVHPLFDQTPDTGDSGDDPGTVTMTA